jgi:hypothetical protein
MPGSGKTTMSHCAAQILREKGTKVREPTYFINNEMGTIQRYLTKSWYSTKLAWLRPVQALQWLFLVVQSRQRTMKDFVLMIVNCFFILEIYRRYSLRNDICFLDQGICQALLSLSYNSKTENFIGKKLGTAIGFFSTLEFRIMHIETDVDTIVQRLQKRHKKRSRLEMTKNTTDFAETIRNEKRKIEKLLRILCTQVQADVNTIQKNGPDDIHSTVQKISGLFIHNQNQS